MTSENTKYKYGTVIYGAWSLEGNAANVAHNIWNNEMSSRQRNGKTDLQNAYDVIQNCIVPEVENFIRQKYAAKPSESRGEKK